MKAMWVERLLVGILLVIAALMVVHAPLTVWAETTWPQSEQYVKAWKELLMGGALILLVVAAYKRKKINSLLNDRLVQLSIVYAGLHFILIGIFGWQNSSNLPAVGAGLLIDLRYVLYFVLVYSTLQLVPQYRRAFIYVFAGGAAIVVTFAILQLLVLPKDILSHIGYGKSTIAPYLTVDDNQDYIRINSTLRGPNPLGAYMVMIIGFITAIVLSWKLTARRIVTVGLIALAVGLTLGASHSRSAFIAAVLAVITASIVAVPAKLRKRVSLVAVALLIVAAGLVVALRNTSFVANVIFHDSPTTGAQIDSNTGHVNSLEDGVRRMARQPLGAGVGSTGSASLNSDQPLIIENQYLFVAHEVGWLGLAIFLWLFVEIMRRLWVVMKRQKKSVLPLAVFSSGIGLAVIGLLLPVWVDDTVSIVWWGLAAVALGSVSGSLDRKKVRNHDKRAHN